MSAYVQTVVGSDSPPVGAVMDFAGNVEPSGWLFCFGQSLPRTGIYAQLFGVIGTLYGSVDGLSFSLPDFRGRVGAGRDDMGGMAANRLVIAKTGNTTNGNTTISAVTNANIDLTLGMFVAGPGITVGTTITGLTATSAVVSPAPTVTATGVALRFFHVDGTLLGGNGGEMMHGLILQELAAHTHSFINIGGSGTFGYQGAGGQNASFSQTTGSTGNNFGHNNVQPTFVVNKIIKYTVSGTVLPIVPGEGDVVGPDGGVADGDLAVFNGTSGKFIKTSGKTFVDPKVSYAGLVCRPSVVLYNNPNLTAVTGTTATVWTFDVVTGLLGKDGDALRLTVGWFNNATAVAKNMTVRFGGVTGHTTSASGATAVWWSATISITRMTATTQRWFTYRTNDALQGGAERFDGSIDTTVNQPLVLQISSTSTGNVQHFSSILEYLPAP